MIPVEGQTVERKESLGVGREIAETCAAFASAQGGRIYIGVRDNGMVVGVQIGKGTLEGLANDIAQNTVSKLVPAITTVQEAGQTVIVVEVAENPTKPVSAYGRAYRRSGRTNQVLSASEAAEMYLQSRGRTWDYTVMSESGIGDLDMGRVKRFLERARAARRLEVKLDTPAEQVLRQLKLIRSGKPTVAGVLLFGRSPAQFLPQATVRCARFKGEAEGTFLDMQVIEAGIIEQVETVMEFARRNLAMAAKIEGALERIETWEYPLEALREAVINAVCHRDYASAASVQVRIFDDRLEVWNPGGLPPELSVRDLRVSHASIPRNKLVADAFFLIGYVEQFGTGTQRMIDLLQQAGLPEPEFESREHFFRVLFRKPVPVEKQFAHSDLNGRQVIALKSLEKSKRITRKEYEKLTGASDVTAKRDLTDLVNKRVLVRRGATRNLWYELSGHPMTRK
jgi:ATP-dependent DNA helicase RecG